MPFVNLGTRNKPLCWEYGSAYSFLHGKIPYSSFNIPLFFAYGTGEKNQHCHNSKSIAQSVEMMKQEFEKGVYDESFFEQLIESFVSICKIFDNPLPANLSTLPDKELLELYNKITIAIAMPNPAMLIALYTMYLDDYFSELIYESLDESEKAASQYFLELKTLLLTTRKATFPQIEEEALINFIMPFIKNNQKPSLQLLKDYCEANDAELEKIVKNFGWFHMEYHKKPATKEDYIDYLWQKVDDPAHNFLLPSQKIAECIQKQDQFFDIHPKAMKLKKLSFALQNFAFILDHTKMIVIKGIFYSLPVYTELSNRLSITEPDFRFLVLPEVNDLITNHQKADKALIDLRKNYRAILLKDGEISAYSGIDAQNLAGKMLETEKTDLQID
jgi:hypothetical protein